jgi:GNAT superfamily N-acetyltransferase
VGLGRLLWRLPRVRSVRLLTVGVLPAWRRRGIAELLMLAAYDAARGLGYRTGEMGWTAADNRLITAACRAFGGEPYKRWRVYARDLATPGVDAPAGRGPAPGATRHAGEGVPA